MGARCPLPAVCNELIHQLSHQEVHVFGGALRLQGQVDLLQASFLWDNQARVKSVTTEQKVCIGINPRPCYYSKKKFLNQKEVNNLKQRRQSPELKNLPELYTPKSPSLQL